MPVRGTSREAWATIRTDVCHPAAGRSRAQESTMSVRPCLECGLPADLPVVDVHGQLHGFLCRWCDSIRRRKLMGWRRRLTRRVTCSIFRFRRGVTPARRTVRSRDASCVSSLTVRAFRRSDVYDGKSPNGVGSDLQHAEGSGAMNGVAWCRKLHAIVVVALSGSAILIVPSAAPGAAAAAGCPGTAYVTNMPAARCR